MTSEQQMESDWFVGLVICVSPWRDLRGRLTFKVTNRLTFRETIGTYARTPASPTSYSYYTGQWATVVVDLLEMRAILLLLSVSFCCICILFYFPLSNHCKICRLSFNWCFGPLGFLKYIPWLAWLNDRMGPTVLWWLGSKAQSS